MKPPLILRPEAEVDLTLTAQWYEAQQKSLGEEFVEQFEAALRRISDRPEMYAIKWMDVRSCRLHQFPYLVYYRILTDRIEVLAVLHGSRSPEIGQSRI